MALLRSFENDDYLPEFGTLMIRDAWDSDAEEIPGLDAFEEGGSDAAPCGTIARAGSGWLEAAAGDGPHVVRLEAHDAAPPDDHDEWSEAVETSYFGVGEVGLTYVTGGAGKPELRLGDPGPYRARVSRRRWDDGGDLWRFQFWPHRPEPPRWLKRDGSAVQDPLSGWDTVLDHHVRDVAYLVYAAEREHVRGGTGVTAEELGEWGARHARQRGWLDQPLWPDPPTPPPSGHADIDAGRLDSRRSVVEDNARRLREHTRIAEQLGVPAPTTFRAALPLLAAAGLLVAEDSGDGPRYRWAADPPRARDVLDLSAETVAQVERRNGFHRFTRFASDLVAVAMWAGGAELTIRELTGRLLATEREVRETLEYAVEQGLLERTEVAESTLILTPLPRRADSVTSGYTQIPAPGPPWHTPSPPAPQIFIGVIGSAGDEPDVDGEVFEAARRYFDGGRAKPYRPPFGDPPRTVITDDEVTVRREREITMSRPRGEPPVQALEAAYGIVLFGMAGESALLRYDGTIMTFGTEHSHSGVLDERGRLLAFTEAEYSRRDARHRLHLIDLADGSRQVMPWDEDRDCYVVAIHEGAVHFVGAQPDGGPRVAMCWAPGGEPEPRGYDLRQIDPLTGTALVYDSGLVVISPDGIRRRVDLDPAAELAPGGRRLYTYRYLPPAVTLFDVETGADNPKVFWLPRGTNPSGAHKPVWEDADHLLVPVPRWEIDAAAVRLDVRTGEFERVPQIGSPIVRPLLAHRGALPK
ncbi:DUF6042 family protein [Actinomadura alba]|uniref:Uncharacterized protein n=1 Tax=Actinomadura alba TaxID=406431 RepID=A0ABR7LWF5_9ACTN|nr:DUF6042 family protein [Actinomadura alba]MBC6468805.1 hypothetical protein [Actinomadura alba]